MDILLQLFLSFAAVGLVCVGGGYASMPLIQAEVIDRHGWLTMNEFVDIFTLSQMTPGPIGNSRFHCSHVGFCFPLCFYCLVFRLPVL